MFTLIVRSIIVYFILLIVVRVMGKRQIGELQPFELVITLVIADLACLPMAETSMPLLHGIVPLLTLLVVQFFLSLFSRKSIGFRNLVCGKPTIVIDSNGVDYQALKELNLNVSDLEEVLRGKGIFCFEDVEYMICETNGSFSILPVEATTPVCIEDTEIKKNQTEFSYIIISGGKFNTSLLKELKISKEFIDNELKKAGISNYKNVTMANIDSNGKMYIKSREGKYILHKTKFRGGL